MKPCMWRKGSSNPITKKPELPRKCFDKHCDGVITDSIMKRCDAYEPEEQVRIVSKGNTDKHNSV